LYFEFAAAGLSPVVEDEISKSLAAEEDYYSFEEAMMMIQMD